MELKLLNNRLKQPNYSFMLTEIKLPLITNLFFFPKRLHYNICYDLVEKKKTLQFLPNLPQPENQSNDKHDDG